MAKKISLEAAAKEWMELKAVEQALEDRRTILKAVLEPALAKAPKNSLVIGNGKFKRVEFPKENFSLKKAKKKIDGRVLAPYITTTNVVQIRAQWTKRIIKMEAA